MLYKFKSKTCGDVIMLQDNGQQILDIIGKRDADQTTPRGILMPDQMTQALASLEAAIAQEEMARREALAQAQREHLPTPHFKAITLHHRALPLMDMMRRCMKDEVPITWGV